MEWAALGCWYVWGHKGSLDRVYRMDNGYVICIALTSWTFCSH